MGRTPDALARLAIDSGFDGVEIHVGRHYLASSFLSPLVNRIAADSSTRSAWTHCNLCMPTIYSRTYCVVTGAPD